MSIHASIRASALGLAVFMLAVGIPFSVAYADSQAPMVTGVWSFPPREISANYSGVDPNGQFAYLGLQTSPARIVKVRLNDLSRVGHFSLPDGKEIGCLLVDPNPASDFLYVGTGKVPSEIIKVRRTGLTSVQTIPLSASQFCMSAVADPSGTYGYFAAGYVIGSSTGKIVKVRLSDLMVVGELPLNSGQRSVQEMLMSPTGQSMYVLTATFDSTQLNRVQLSTLTIESTMAWNLPDGAVRSASIDPEGRYAYFATHSGRLVKVDLASMTRIGHLGPTFDSMNVTELRGPIMHPGGTYVYITGISPNEARLLRIRLSDFSFQGFLTLMSGDGGVVPTAPYPTTMFRHPNALTAYVAVQPIVGGAPPSTIIQVGLDNFVVQKSLQLDWGARGGARSVAFDKNRDTIFIGGGTNSGCNRQTFDAGQLAQIGMSDLSWKGAIQLEPKESCPVVTLTDSDRQAVYVGTHGPDSPPGGTGTVATLKFIKFTGTPLTRASAIEFPPPPESQKMVAGIIDSTRQVAYLVMERSGHRLVKVNLQTFSIAGEILFPNSSISFSQCGSMLLDSTGTTLYIGGSHAIMNVDTQNLAVIGELPFASNFTAYACSGAIDPNGQKAYFAIQSQSPQVIRLDLNTFTIDQTLPLPSLSAPSATMLDPLQGFLYIATAFGGSPSRSSVETIRVNDFTFFGPSLDLGTNYQVTAGVTDAAQGVGYVIGAAESSRLSRIGFIRQEEPSELPIAPAGLTTTPLSPASIELRWQDQSSNETSFVIERGFSPTSFQHLTTVASNSTSYTNDGLNPGTTYQYRVRASNASGDSAPSNTHAATTPTSITVTSNGFDEGHSWWVDVPLTFSLDRPGPASSVASYRIWWNCNNESANLATVMAACGDPVNSDLGARAMNTTADPQTFTHIFSQPTGAGWPTMVKVLLQQGGATAEGRLDIAFSDRPHLSVTLTASPSEGTVPLTTTLTARRMDTVPGNTRHYFWWNCPTEPCGPPDYTTFGNTVVEVPHIYTTSGTFQPRVMVESAIAPSQGGPDPASGGTTATTVGGTAVAAMAFTMVNARAAVTPPPAQQPPAADLPDLTADVNLSSASKPIVDTYLYFVSKITNQSPYPTMISAKSEFRLWPEGQPDKTTRIVSAYSYKPGANVTMSESSSFRVQLSTPGTYTYQMCADTQKTVTESNEDNNCSTEKTLDMQQAPQPDFIVDSITVNRSGTVGSVKAVIRNIGTKSYSGSLYNNLTVNGRKFPSQSAYSLAMGSSKTLTWSSVGLLHGVNTITVTANSSGISELDKTNNTLEKIEVIE